MASMLLNTFDPAQTSIDRNSMREAKRMRRQAEAAWDRAHEAFRCNGCADTQRMLLTAEAEMYRCRDLVRTLIRAEKAVA